MAGTVRSRHVVPLAACVGEDAAARTGGKAVGLGRLLQAGLPAPGGFAVTTDAYREALREQLPRIDDLLGAGGTAAANEAASTAIRALVEATPLPAGIAQAITAAYTALGDDVPVAVRSSATAEDTGEASFAGQQDTFLWVRGTDAVLEHVVRCWSSLFTPHAIGYRERVAYSAEDLAMAVVVQEMVDAEAAGVALTLDPATGDRATVYLEVALGLGEGVVRGDVPVDRVWLAKEPPAVTRMQTTTKDREHRFDAAAGAVRIAPVDPARAAAPALSEDEALAVGALAARIEAEFGRPMDVEWAVGSDRQVALLQARPETVWSRREPLPAPGTADAWDPLHHTSAPGAHWTTTNFGETAPGVLTPLAWTLWGPAAEGAIRGAAWALGALDDDERATPEREADRFVTSFYGRAALKVEFLATVGDRMPGTTGEEAVRSLLGEPPAGIAYAPTRRRWFTIARKLPVVTVKGPGWLHAEAERTERWWKASIARVDTLDRAGAARLFAEAEESFRRTLLLQTTGVLGLVQPLYDALGRLCAKTGIGDVNTLSSGYSGFKEVAVVGELWRAAHGQTTVAAIVAEHGFHGPLEGELSTRVWREQPEILEGLLDQYREREDPRVRDAELRARREGLERELVAAVPRPLRPAVRGLLRMCAARIPLRGVAKRSFLQSIDVARAAARRFGDCLVAEGVLTDREDVFYLTTTELTGTLPPDVAALLQRRRGRRESYRALAIPASWAGDCVPVDPTLAHDGDPDVVAGIGVSAGVVEGVVRVLESSSSKDLQPDEILVAPATDPSWSSIMFISAALVVDIGGALSHASMVARELGIPCVVGTGDGTRRLKTGDRVRVDGGRGVVEVLER